VADDQPPVQLGELFIPGNNRQPKLRRNHAGKQIEEDLSNKWVAADFRPTLDKLKAQRSESTIKVEFEWRGSPKDVREASDAAVANFAEQERRRRVGFYNPYNFIPAPRRKQNDPHLGDRAPLGHHRYFDEHYTGWLQVTLTTATPLLLPDAAQVEERPGNHKTFPVRKGCDRLPILAATSVKGALSSAYEAITNSRLRVFQGHEQRLARRMKAEDGLSLVPARIDGDHIQLLMGDTPGFPRLNKGKGVWEIPQRRMYAAWLSMYGQHGRDWMGLAVHRRKVWAYVTRWKHSQPYFEFWNVEELVDGDCPKPEHPPDEQKRRRRRHKAVPDGHPEGHWVQGYVCLTNQNISRKHDERVFFIEEKNPFFDRHRLPLPMSNNVNSLAVQWMQLIQSYQSAHSEAAVWHRTNEEHGVRSIVPPEAYIGDEPGQTAWSRQIYLDGKPRRDATREAQEDASVLKDGDLCYARVAETGRGIEVVAIYPVMISRELFEKAPCQLLDKSLRRASLIDELSPADRVFGCVAPPPDQRQRSSGQQAQGEPQQVAYKGQLRINRVRYAPSEGHEPIEEFEGDGVPLAILSAPKPSQASFYVADSQGRPISRKNDGYRKNQQLRPRKVYPHHRAVANDEAYWGKSTAQQDQTQSDEFARRHAGSHQEYRRVAGRTDDQNRSMREWVRIGSNFTCKIHLTNLTQVELGALLWLLSLDQQYEGEQHFLRLCGGKPLGFGSVKVQIDESQLRSGQEWREFYSSLTNSELDGQQQVQLRSDAIDAYMQAVTAAYGNGKSFEEIDFIRSFLVASRGCEYGPVHNPRTDQTPTADGENFKWFSDVADPLPLLTDEDPRLSYTAADRPDGSSST
jgi:CRISPR-associated protein (TIGR03986 family)